LITQQQQRQLCPGTLLYSRVHYLDGESLSVFYVVVCIFSVWSVWCM
jgi:hypothetical protein